MTTYNFTDTARTFNMQIRLNILERSGSEHYENVLLDHQQVAWSFYSSYFIYHYTIRRGRNP